ncbi:hypothetical protein KJY73_17820 [Bowmanella sp. Y26]|uniref:hypothetical protein n=1 Tax=Bowmanella yangjiangensis TaxID=2811230 RepID=UPI001BDDA1DC|nr:hypothetical protein [Bowmanella yangjiangensis]MBT1065450.1 hypothetical protein [Bowmanella yangjiangensis]
MVITEWLSSWLGLDRAYCSPVLSIRQRTYQTQLAREFKRQRRKAQQMQQQGWHWGNTGYLVAQAIAQVQQICVWPATESSEMYFTRVQTELDALKTQWRSNSMDEAGYASATVSYFQQQVRFKLGHFCRIQETPN